MESRAYTHIDRGVVTLGNRWIERQWSTFLGRTSSFVQKGDGVEWVAGGCGEFRVEVDDTSFGVLDFGEVAWSEENSAVGATVVVRKTRPGLDVSIRTLAWHKYPALVRSVRVYNRGSQSVFLKGATVDSLSLRRDAIVEDAGDTGVALTLADRGLIAGAMHGAAAESRAGVLAVTAPCARTVAPGESWTSPETFLVAYWGALGDALRFTLAEFLERCVSFKNQSVV
ncbi:MAG TPA: hypothetical protein HPP77_08065 [Candidatus Hydrogenedentes bacterium]|nr:hypothetical protein [Candidatus Hydrogenedentota bacterium]HIJ73965.1 hypothetical protein [Candidatus Hydrogenedentota bacterium]